MNNYFIILAVIAVIIRDFIVKILEIIIIVSIYFNC